MDIAKNSDLPDLLEHLGYQVKRVGRYYTTREIDSIRISSRQSPLHGKRPNGHSPLRSLASPLPMRPTSLGSHGGPNYWTWRRYSNGKGGDTITFLQEFEGKGFREAVEYLLDFNGRSRDAPSASRPRPPPVEEEKPEFVLPPANEDNRRVFAYLRKRGIAPQVIRSFLNAGLLYEDAKYHNCVFVGRDSTGQPKFASKRGTYDKDGVSFKRDVLGSDKSVAFPIPCDPAVPWVLVFEAPIDMMSFCTLHREARSNAVALCGLYEGGLNTYLRDNPHLRHVVLCLDADNPGREATEKLRAEYESRGLKVSTRTPAKGKDWNEYLQQRGPPRERGGDF